MEGFVWVVSLIVYGAIWGAPAWVPLLFAAFAIGRRRWSLRLLLLFIFAEAVVCAVAVKLIPYND